MGTTTWYPLARCKKPEGSFENYVCTYNSSSSDKTTIKSGLALQNSHHFITQMKMVLRVIIVIKAQVDFCASLGNFKLKKKKNKNPFSYAKKFQEQKKCNVSSLIYFNSLKCIMFLADSIFLWALGIYAIKTFLLPCC